jgi:hypothetical protein
MGVQGYDDDSREVYEIPEVRDWFSKAEKEVLGWSYYLFLESEFQLFLCSSFALASWKCKALQKKEP